jgi:hypothetical protein
LPEGTNNVWVFKLQELFKSPVGKQYDNLLKAKLSDYYLLLQNRGIDLYADVDRVAYAVYPTGNSLSLFALFQGSFDGRKFQEAMEQARPRPVARKVPRAGGQQYYEFPAGPGELGPSLVWLVNDHTLVLCNEQKLFNNGLMKGTGIRSADLNDKDVQRQLENLDDKPALYLIIGGSFAPGGNSLLNSGGIRCITCGFRPSADLQATYVVTMRDLDTAQGFRPGAAQFFKGLLDKFDDTASLSGGVDSTSVKLNEKDNTISVQARYTAQQVTTMLKR